MSLKVIETSPGFYEFHNCDQLITNSIRRALLRYVCPITFGKITVHANTSVGISEILKDKIKSVPIKQSSLPPNWSAIKWTLRVEEAREVTSKDIKFVGQTGAPPEIHTGFEIIKLNLNQRFYASGSLVKKPVALGTRVAVIIDSYKETTKKTTFHDKTQNVICMQLAAKLFYTIPEALNVACKALADKLVLIAQTFEVREIDELNSYVIIPNEDKTASMMIIADIEARDNGITATINHGNPNSKDVEIRIYGTSDPTSFIQESITFLINFLKGATYKFIA